MKWAVIIFTLVLTGCVSVPNHYQGTSKVQTGKHIYFKDNLSSYFVCDSYLGSSLNSQEIQLCTNQKWQRVKPSSSKL